MNCDFCSMELTDNHKRYPASDFVHREVNGVQLASGGDWCACDVCAFLIDTEEWANLLTRSADTFFENNPEFKGRVPYQSVVEQVQELHGQFRQARKQACHGET
jgi:hypothetical protein